MLFPYNVDVPMKHVPWANWGVIALTTFISFAIFSGWDPRDYLSGPQPSLPDFNSPDKFPSEEWANLQKYMEERQIPPLALNPKKFSVEQLFSCTLVHADFLHLFGNMLFLFVFGNAVNGKLGHLPYLLIYLASAALASCAWLVLGNGIPAVGASGAIMGIVGAFLIFFPRNDVQVFFLNIFLARAGLYSFTVASWLLILIYLGFDLYGSIRGGDGVANVAHLGGALAGIILAILWLGFGWTESERGEENLLQMLGFSEKNEE